MNNKYLISGIILLIIVAIAYFISNPSRINGLALKELCTASRGEYHRELKQCLWRNWPEGNNTEKKCQEINGTFINEWKTECMGGKIGACWQNLEITCTLK